MLQIYVNNLGEITKVKDSSFFVTGNSNVNSLHVYAPQSANITNASVSFERKDGFKATQMAMTMNNEVINEDDAKWIEFYHVINESSHVLDLEGNLAISFTLKNYANQKLRILNTIKYISRVHGSVQDYESDLMNEIRNEVQDMLDETKSQVNEHLYQGTSNVHLAEQIKTTDGSNVQNKLSELRGDLNDFNESVSTNSQNIATLQTKANNQKGQIDELFDHIDDVKSRIDTINATQNVVDILPDKATLLHYDVTYLDVNDKVEVLNDESENGANTIYQFDKDAWVWMLVGSKAPYYSKTESDGRYALKGEGGGGASDAQFNELRTEIENVRSTAQSNTSSINETNQALNNTNARVTTLEFQVSGIPTINANVMRNSQDISQAKNDIAQLKERVSKVYTSKGSVATYNDLPDTTDWADEQVGWVYNVLDTGINYAWADLSENGTGTYFGWDEIGTTFDTSDLATKEDIYQVNSDVLTAFDQIHELEESKLSNNDILNSSTNKVKSELLPEAIAGGQYGIIGIPPATYRKGIGRANKTPTLELIYASNSELDNRQGGNVIAPNNIDYAVKCALTDGKGAAYTDSEKAAARARLGITKITKVSELSNDSGFLTLATLPKYDGGVQ